MGWPEEAVTERVDVCPEIVAELRSICLALPETYEEAAWVGTRWRVRTKTFAHVLVVDAEWPPVYARAARVDAPTTVLTFRAAGPDLDAMRHGGRPFFPMQWPPDIVGLILDTDVDRDELSQLLADSYRILAPKKLAALVEPPGTG